MKVRVRYLAQLKIAAGRGEETLDLPGPLSVAELLAHLAERHASSLRHLLLTPAGTLQPTLLIFVGDEQVTPGRPLAEGEEVTLLTPIAGGSS